LKTLNLNIIQWKPRLRRLSLGEIQDNLRWVPKPGNFPKVPNRIPSPFPWASNFWCQIATVNYYWSLPVVKASNNFCDPFIFTINSTISAMVNITQISEMNRFFSTWRQLGPHAIHFPAVRCAPTALVRWSLAARRGKIRRRRNEMAKPNLWWASWCMDMLVKIWACKTQQWAAKDRIEEGMKKEPGK
jgi:hypothetical protein